MILFCSFLVAFLICCVFDLPGEYILYICPALWGAAWVVRVIFAAADAVAKERREKELNRRGYKTMTVTRKIRHQYKGMYPPYDSEETREEEIIVPMDERYR